MATHRGQEPTVDGEAGGPQAGAHRRHQGPGRPTPATWLRPMGWPHGFTHQGPCSGKWPFELDSRAPGHVSLSRLVSRGDAMWVQSILLTRAPGTCLLCTVLWGG